MDPGDAGDPGDRVGIRHARAADVPAIAALHADNWRRHYRGAYADRYLDGDLEADRLWVWSERIGCPAPERCTLVAVDGSALVGFSHLLLDADPTWGALVDNLHVTHTHRRRGLGGRLLAATARTVADRRPGSGLHLWVLEQNADARAFYRAQRAQPGGGELVQPPGGDPRNLEGAPVKVRMCWPDPTVLT